jgi:hypothetical protein
VQPSYLKITPVMVCLWRCISMWKPAISGVLGVCRDAYSSAQCACTFRAWPLTIQHFRVTRCIVYCSPEILRDSKNPGVRLQIAPRVRYLFVCRCLGAGRASSGRFNHRVSNSFANSSINLMLSVILLEIDEFEYLCSCALFKLFTEHCKLNTWSMKFFEHANNTPQTSFLVVEFEIVFLGVFYVFRLLTLDGTLIFTIIQWNVI